MRPFHPRRVFSSGCGFSLLELLITLGLIGIIAAALIPKLFEVREETLRQAARQQVKNMETALGNWLSAQDSVKAASAVWTTYDSSQGYINSSTFLDWSNLGKYLPQSGESFTLRTGGLIDTPTMTKLPIKAGASPAFIGGSISSADDSLGYAHLRLYWDPSNRRTSSPKVLFFLPTIP